MNQKVLDKIVSDLSQYIEDLQTRSGLSVDEMCQVLETVSMNWESGVRTKDYEDHKAN